MGAFGIDVVGMANQNNAENERIREENRLKTIQQASGMAGKIKELPNGAAKKSLLEVLEKHGGRDPKSLTEAEYDEVLNEIKLNTNLSPRDKQQKLEYYRNLRQARFPQQNNYTYDAPPEPEYDPKNPVQNPDRINKHMDKLWKDLD